MANLSFGYCFFVLLSNPTYLDVSSLILKVTVQSKVIVTSLKLAVNRHCYFSNSTLNRTMKRQVNHLLFSAG